MSEHLLFHIAFLCQVLLVSFYLPWKIHGRMGYIFETYPPSTHPRLYARPAGYYESAQRAYRLANGAILLGGLALLGVLLFSARSGKWDHVIASWFFLVQCVPLMILDLSALRNARLMRETCSTRKADLRPRRLFDFLSPAVLGLVIFTYVAFVLLVLYVRQFEFPWFGGYLNIVGATFMNLLLAGVAFRQIYGKKLNPHQPDEDRRRQIKTLVNILATVSLGGTGFIALSITLAALDRRDLQPALQSFYFQLLAVVCFRAYLIGSSNYDVYKDDQLAT